MPTANLMSQPFAPQPSHTHTHPTVCLHNGREKKNLPLLLYNYTKSFLTMLSIIYHVYTSFLRYIFKSDLLFFTVFIIFQFFCGLVPSVAHLERNDGETIKECEWGWIACQTGQRRSCGEQNRERQRREWKTRSKPAGSATGLPVQNCWTCLVAPLSFVALRTERLFFTRFSPVFFISPKMPARNRSGDGEIREGWRGRWEEERRGVMDESERWEATRRPSSVCEFLSEPTRPRRPSSPSYKRRTRVCPCEDQAGTSRRKNRTNPQHRISNTSSILLSPATFDLRGANHWLMH